MGERRAGVLVGALGSVGVAEVDGRGLVSRKGRPFELDWWVGTDDGWRRGGASDRPRQARVGVAPVVQTTLRVPGGEAVQRVWGTAGPGGPVVVEVQNSSAAAFAVAFVVRPRLSGGCRSVEVRDTTVVIDGHPAVVLPRAARAWAVAPAGRHGVAPAVTEGRTRRGEFERFRDRRGVEAAFVFPVPHRSSVRCVVLLDPSGAKGGVDPRALPDAAGAETAWRALIDRGMRVELFDDALQHAVDACRADLLLVAGERDGREAQRLVALEDWGFDFEAAEAWKSLGSRARRAASRRAPSPVEPWDRVRTYLAAASPALSFPGGPAPFLTAVRELIVREADGAMDLLAGLPDEWLGRDLAVHAIPHRLGSVSFAVRWHGQRPALLWEAPEGLRLTASRLDATWSAAGGSGEALLGSAPPEVRSPAGLPTGSAAPDTFA